MSELDQVHDHLIKHGKIDQMVALNYYNCMKLENVIWELEKHAQITTETKRMGDRSWYVYHYDEDQTPDKIIYDDRFVHPQPVWHGDTLPLTPKANEELDNAIHMSVVPVMIKRLIMAGVQIPPTIVYYSYDMSEDIPSEYFESEEIVSDVQELHRMLNDISPDGCSFGQNDEGRFGWWPIVWT